MARSVPALPMAALLAALSAGVASAGEAGGGEWPCDVPRPSRLTIGDVWDGPAPAIPDGDWRQRAGVREVVSEAAAPANPPEHGRQAIRDFARELGDKRRTKLLLVLQGLIERTNELRGIIAGGIRSYAIRADILREAVTEKERALQRLQADGAPAGRIEEYRRARDVDQRRLDDAEEEARFHCSRYEYAREKLADLAGAIQSLVASRGSG